MIQRIQTIYLLLGAVAIGTLLFFDALWQSPAAETYAWFAPALVVLGAVVSVMAVVSVFLYKNRERQLKVVLGVQVLTVLFTAVFYGGFVLAGGPGEEMDAAILTALILPVLAYAVFYMARRGIRNDIELVRSMDRLRG